MAHYTNDAERIMLSALQLAVDDIARTVATPELFPAHDPFRIERSARILSVRVSQTFMVAYAFTRSVRVSSGFLDALEELNDLAHGLIPDPAEWIDWDTEWAALNGGAA